MSSFFDDFLKEISLANLQEQGQLSIIEFANRIIFNGDEDFQLYPTQKAILKTFYNEPLTPEEKVIVEEWKKEDRTTWVENRNYISLVLEAGRRASKALALSALIATPTGYKKYGDIHVGDYVFTPKGKPTKVIKETEVFYNKKCYKLEFQNGETIECSAEHEWFTWTKAACKSYQRATNPTIHPSIKTTQEIVDTLYINRKNGKLENNHSIELTQPLEYTEKILPIDPYILGLWLANGYYNSSMITSSKEDIEEVINKLNILGYDTYKTPTKDYTYKFSSNLLTQQLKTNNLLGNKNKEAPSIYLISSINQRLELLRGLMDSDGYYDKKGKAYFCNTNTNITNLVYQLALSLGCAASKTNHIKSYKNKKGKKIICKEYTRVSLKPNFNPFFLKRKAERFKPCLTQNDKRFIVKATEINPIPVKCITVEDSNHLFLIGEELIPTHNCNAASATIPTTIGEITYQELYDKLHNKEKVGIYTYDFSKNIVNSYITYDIKSELNEVEEVYKITTQTGKTEITNKNHPFLTFRQQDEKPVWRKLSELNIGEKIATSACIPVFGTKELSKEEANLIALFICLRKKEENVFSKGVLSAIKITEILNFKFKEREDFYFNNGDLYCASLNIQKYYRGISENIFNDLSKESTIKLLKYICKYGLVLIASLYARFAINKKYEKCIAKAFNKLGILIHITRKGLRIKKTNSWSIFLNIFGKAFNNYSTDIVNRSIKKVSYYSAGYIENQLPKIFDKSNKDRGQILEKKKLLKAFKNNTVVGSINKNKEYLYDFATNDINWETITKIESQGIEQTIALEVKDTNVIGSYIISHNSTMASIIALKEFYDLIIMKNPHKHYGMITGSPIAILVMAQSQAQVKETIFAAIKGYAENSHFFTALKETGKIDILAEEIRCPEKNVAIYAKHTNSKSLVGYTLKCMLLDEVARFETIGEEGKNKAFEIWRNVATGGAAFGTSFKKVAISSAWEPNDPIEVLYEDAKRDPNTLGFKLTTFQVNLQLKKGITPVIVSDYTTDFTKARREYEGIRFSKFNTFIDVANLNRSATGTSCIDAIPHKIDIESESGIRHYAGVKIMRLAPNPNPQELGFIHIDPALKKDSAALAIARPTKIDNKWKIQIDALLKWEPHVDEKGLRRIVSFLDIEEKLYEIIPVRNIKRVTFDQWQSQAFIQKLHSKGIDSQEVSCSREMQFAYYTLFRDLLAHDYIIFPCDSLWTNNAITELSELVMKSNKQIIHPYAGKDLADAIVNAVFQCHQYMIRVGLNLTTGLNTGVVQSQRLASVTRFGQKHLEIGKAIDKLYDRKK